MHVTIVLVIAGLAVLFMTVGALDDDRREVPERRRAPDARDVRHRRCAVACFGGSAAHPSFRHRPRHRAYDGEPQSSGTAVFCAGDAPEIDDRPLIEPRGDETRTLGFRIGAVEGDQVHADMPVDAGAPGKTVALATKCDLCHGRAAGPACVQMCPQGSATRISFSDSAAVARLFALAPASSEVR